MKVEDVYKYFGGKTQAISTLTDRFGFNRCSFYHWAEIVPMRSAARIEVLTKGKLKFNAKDYVFDGELMEKTRKNTKE